MRGRDHSQFLIQTFAPGINHVSAVMDDFKRKGVNQTELCRDNRPTMKFGRSSLVIKLACREKESSNRDNVIFVFTPNWQKSTNKLISVH